MLSTFIFCVQLRQPNNGFTDSLEILGRVLYFSPINQTHHSSSFWPNIQMYLWKFQTSGHIELKYFLRGQFAITVSFDFAFNFHYRWDLNECDTIPKWLLVVFFTRLMMGVQYETIILTQWVPLQLKPLNRIAF